MKIIFTKKKLVKFIKNERNLGFVPTMGALHPGHISLIKKSKLECEKTLVTIFVNKPQFERSSDYISYPRNLKKDILILKNLKINYLYLPKFKEIYPSGANTNIKIDPFKKKLCGKFRLGHFESIVDVIDRFIKLIKPKKAFFGKKDMQQYMLVKNFVNKNSIKTKIIGCKTIRHKNGLAYSSRNFLLTKMERKKAGSIYMLIKNNKNKIIKNKLFLNVIKKKILKLGVNKIEYLKILDINKVIRPFKKKIKLKIFIAYYIRSVRLIDNI